MVTPAGEQIFSLMMAGCSFSSKAAALLKSERVRFKLRSFDNPSYTPALAMLSATNAKKQERNRL